MPSGSVAPATEARPPITRYRLSPKVLLDMPIRKPTQTPIAWRSAVAVAVGYGPIVTIPGTTLQKGASAFYFVFEHISFNELSDTVLEAAARATRARAHRLATLESPMLGYSYGLTDRLMVSALLPYVVRTGIREASHDRRERQPW